MGPGAEIKTMGDRHTGRSQEKDSRLEGQRRRAEGRPESAGGGVIEKADQEVGCSGRGAVAGPWAVGHRVAEAIFCQRFAAGTRTPCLRNRQSPYGPLRLHPPPP